ncbi:hypothetical protein MBRA1_001842 [Malassezia brasiliensis]|uniref:DNA damage-binding protein 1 n=1 Tax=Malassezia brasiliensis TaxID=1821822 RepID=A0AAF0DS54_9BASI|nr:hypothetical protein MBRA1_001842 [Malassezia brasiliensis]
MLWLSQTHPASATVAAVRLDRWYPDGPCLCVAQQSALAFYALAEQSTDSKAEQQAQQPLSLLERVPLRARILALEAIRTEGTPDRIVLLTDHPVPRLIVLRPANTSDVYDASQPRPLPHVFLVHAAFLARRDEAPAVLALLSLSSKPSQIAGFGEQGMPVLSFHVPDSQTQQLEPVPWGPPRKAPPPSEVPAEYRSPIAPGRHKRPAAVGQRIDAAEIDARERAWLMDPLVHAHVPLPVEDARTAHLLCAVPAEAGGGVLVFCETSIVYVPPPAAPTPVRPRGGTRSAKEKRRMSAGKEAHTEHVQRPRAAPKRRKMPGADTDTSEGDAADEGARSEMSDVALALTQLVHLRVGRPMTVASATVLDDAPHDGPVEVLLGTTDGILYVLKLERPAPDAHGGAPVRVARMQLRRVGHSSVPSGPRGLTPVGEHFVHISSAQGDAVLVHVDDVVSDVYRWANLAPIVDLAVEHGADDARTTRAQRRVVTCSGAGPTCSVRVFWNGVATTEVARIGVASCLGVDAVHAYTPDAVTALLVLRFAAHTQVLDCARNMADVTDAFRALGVPLDERAVHVKSVRAAAPTWVLVTRRVVAAVLPNTCVPWMPPDGAEIVAADAQEDGGVLVGLQGGHVLLLSLHDGAWAVRASHRLGADVAGVALPGAGTLPLALVSVWDPPALVALSVPDLTPCTFADGPRHALGALGVSLRLHSFAPGAPTYVLVGLATGAVEAYSLAHIGAPLHHVHTLHVGHGAARIAAAHGHSVVAFGEQAYMVSLHGERLQYSALRYTHLRAVAPLVLPSADGAAHVPLVAALTPEALHVFSVDDLNGTDVRTVDLGTDQPTAIVAHDTTGAYVVTTWPALDAERGAEANGAVRIVRPTESVLGAPLRLLRNERPNCVTVATLHGRTLVLVGTGFMRADEEETGAGRLLGLEAAPDAALVPVFALDVPGNVYGVAFAAGHLVAAINAQVHTYAFDAAASAIALVSRWGCAFVASSLALAPDDRTIVVGDAMRSLTVLAVSDTGALTELARDLDPYWTTAVAAYDTARQQYLGADIAMNLFVTARVPTHVQGEWGHVMRRTAAFHYGDMINRFVPAPPIAADDVQPRAQLGTAGGELGVACEVDDDLGSLLDLVQQSLAQETAVPGAIPWDEWRTLRTDHRTAPSRGVLDGALLRTFLTCTPVQRERVVAIASHLARKKERGAAPISSDAVLRALDRLAMIS